MAPQVWIFYLYLGLALVVFGVFAFVAGSTRQPRPIGARGVARLRVAFAALLVLVLGSALGFTLRQMPYDLGEGEVPDHTVFVVGKQFAFAVSETPVISDEEFERQAAYGEIVKVAVDMLVEFRVTSLDVNHSMGLYDPDGTLIGQIQGMPGYLNRLRMRFAREGRYMILCLELCGNGHSRMRGVLDVVHATS
jgi:cytochrome c oxidase subunit 2